MSLWFRQDTPEAVLASVSALEQPLRGDEAPWWGPAPSLPQPVREPVDGWAPDWRDDYGFEDPFETEPWRHDWATWLSGSMSVGTAPSAALVWMPARRWNLTCRCSFKAGADSIYVFLGWFGPFIDTGDSDRPSFVGYIEDEHADRPYLLWAQDRRLLMEDLNVTSGGFAS